MSIFSLSRNSNWVRIPHLRFDTGDYGVHLPLGLGIPGDKDGPRLLVCLDCGRVNNEEYPISDEAIEERITVLYGRKPRPTRSDLGIAHECLCGSGRIIDSYSKACNGNWLEIPHLGLKFSEHGIYMPTGFGIPGDGDGPSLQICLDCGRVVNEKFPLLDTTIQQRIKTRERNLL